MSLDFRWTPPLRRKSPAFHPSYPALIYAILIIRQTFSPFFSVPLGETSIEFYESLRKEAALAASIGGGGVGPVAPSSGEWANEGKGRDGSILSFLLFCAQALPPLPPLRRRCQCERPAPPPLPPPPQAAGGSLAPPAQPRLRLRGRSRRGWPILRRRRTPERRDPSGRALSAPS